MLSAARNIRYLHASQPATYALPMHIGDRVTKRLTAIDQRPVDLARSAGLSRSAISQWQDGSVQKIRPENLVAAADFLKCEIRWLATGQGPEEQFPRLTEDQRAIVDATNQMPARASRTLLSVALAMLDEYRPAERPVESTSTIIDRRIGDRRLG